MRGLLCTLGEAGLGELIRQEYDLNREDLHLLAWMEEEIRKLQPKKKEES